MLTPEEPRILWMRLVGLGGIQGAISLLWVTYNLYLPQLLAQVGLPSWTTPLLLITENLIAVLIEPLSGRLSDQMKYRLSTHYPWVTAGGIATALVFLSLPAIAGLGTVTPITGWVLGGAILTWALAMATFRSPIMALLGQCAALPELPVANSILIMIGTSIGAIAPLWGMILKAWNPWLLFALSSMTLLAAGGLLQQVYPQSLWSGAINTTAPTPQPFLLKRWIAIFLLGSLLNFAISVLKGYIGPNLAKPETQLGFAIFLISHLVSLLPAAQLAERIGNTRLMLFATGTMAATLAGLSSLPLTPPPLPAIALLGIALSPIVNGMLPWVLSHIPTQQSGLAVGLFFGGSAFATSITGLLHLQTLPLDLRLGLGVGAFLLAALIWILPRDHEPHAADPVL